MQAHSDPVGEEDSEDDSAVRGPPFKSPKGHSRPGFKWNPQTGKWYKQKSQASIAETSTSLSIERVGAREGGEATIGADSLEEADGNTLTGRAVSRARSLSTAPLATLGGARSGTAPVAQLAARGAQHSLRTWSRRNRQHTEGPIWEGEDRRGATIRRYEYIRAVL